MKYYSVCNELITDMDNSTLHLTKWIIHCHAEDQIYERAMGIKLIWKCCDYNMYSACKDKYTPFFIISNKISWRNPGGI